MKTFTLNTFVAVCITISATSFAIAQNNKIDSVVKVLNTTKADTARLSLLENIVAHYNALGEYEKYLPYATQGVALAKRYSAKKKESYFELMAGAVLSRRGDNEAIEHYLNSIRINKEIKNYTGIRSGYQNMGWHHDLQGDVANSTKAYKQAIEAANLCIEDAQKRKLPSELGKNQIVLADYYRNLGNNEVRLGNFKNALDYYLRGLKLCNNLLAHTDTESERNVIRKSLSHCYEGLAVMYSAQGSVLETSIGLTPVVIEKIELSLENDIMASTIRAALLKDAHKNGDAKEIKQIELLLGRSYNNIGSGYSQLHKYDEANKAFIQGLVIAEKYNEKGDEIFLYSNMAQIYHKQGTLSTNRDSSALLYEKSRTQYQKALALAEEEKDKGQYVLAPILYNIAGLLQSQGNLDSAIATLERSVRYAEERGFKEQMEKGYKRLAEYNRERNDFRAAFIYQEKYSDIKDSILNETTSRQIEDLHTQYETEKKNQQILVLNKERDLEAMKFREQKFLLDKQMFLTQQRDNEIIILNQGREINELELGKRNLQLKEQKLLTHDKESKLRLQAAAIETEKSKRNYMIAGFAILVVFSTITTRYFLQKRKLAFSKQISETEMKALRAQMNPHFIFNALNSIYRCLQENNVKAGKDYLISFSKLTRMILENSMHQFITLSEEIKALELYLSIERLRMNKNIEFAVSVADDLDPETTMIPPLILQPFLENSIWHGFVHKDGRIDIRIQKQDGMLRCIVEDDGAGIHHEKRFEVNPYTEKKESLGMKLTQQRIDIINKIKKAKGFVAVGNILNEKQQVAGVKVELVLPLEMKY